MSANKKSKIAKAEEILLKANEDAHKAEEAVIQAKDIATKAEAAAINARSDAQKAKEKDKKKAEGIASEAQEAAIKAVEAVIQVEDAATKAKMAAIQAHTAVTEAMAEAENTGRKAKRAKGYYVAPGKAVFTNRKGPLREGALVKPEYFSHPDDFQLWLKKKFIVKVG